MTDRRQVLYWVPWESPGCEQVFVDAESESVLIRGLGVRAWDEAHLRFKYQLELDPRWRARRLAVEVDAAADGYRLDALLERGGDGCWRLDGKEAPDLDGCVDIDIAVTPVTNTLPIRRLRLGKGESATIKVAYIAMPSLRVRAVEQRYSCVQALAETGGCYAYEGLFRAFTAELRVDKDGFVIDYPAHFRRLWPLAGSDHFSGAQAEEPPV